jgi:sugar/nucleoside kinase (ribokinase family)
MDAYNKIERDYLVYTNSIPQVELIIHETGERKENYSLIAENLKLPAVNLNQFDGILLNMISGYDLSLAQLKHLRKNYQGLIYFDVHTLSRGVDKYLNRIFRRISNFNEWAECIDILQVNESELLTVSDKNNEQNIVEELFSYGIKQIIITKAEKGAIVYLKENNSITKIQKDALLVEVSNKVGCGDVFGSVYFYNYIKNKNVILALEQANLFAGITATFSDAEDFLNLKKNANKWISQK